jgi:hypothetical protein
MPYRNQEFTLTLLTHVKGKVATMGDCDRLYAGGPGRVRAVSRFCYSAASHVVRQYRSVSPWSLMLPTYRSKGVAALIFL